MANKEQAVFVKVGPGGIRVNGKVVYENERVIGNYEKIKGLPGLHFVGYKDEIDRAILQNAGISVISQDKEELSITVSSGISKEPKNKEESKEKITGFSQERLKQLKEVKKVDWVKKKKSEFIEILEEGNIDYSAVKDDRMALYKFLIGILEEL